jgi:hypothetical protein
VVNEYPGQPETAVPDEPAGEKCDRCKSVGEDRRTLWMACFYAMNELDIPFEEKEFANPEEGRVRKFFTLRVCKRCRGEWMGAIEAWFEANPQGNDHDGETPPQPIGSGIFIREKGVTREISREEWDRRAKGIEPVVFRADA